MTTALTQKYVEVELGKIERAQANDVRSGRACSTCCRWACHPRKRMPRSGGETRSIEVAVLSHQERHGVVAK